MSDLSAEILSGIRQAAQLIKTCRRSVALTGAGISTHSGIPDFRSQGSGLWTRYLPMEVASLTTFATTQSCSSPVHPCHHMIHNPNPRPPRPGPTGKRWASASHHHAEH
jgi:NAD-dependent deacetylase